jgi:urease accessory protein
VKATAGATLEGGRFVHLRSEPPLVVRSPKPGELWLVGGAGGPLGGDDLEFSLDVGDGESLAVHSAGAQLVQPGPPGLHSTHRIHARVGAGATLHWAPEPTVLVAGCDHRMSTVVDLTASSSLWWREELVLGRFDELPGLVTSTLRITVDGSPVVHHEWSVHPVAIGDARVVLTLVVARPGLEHVRPALLDGGAVFPADGPAVLITVLGRTLPDARRTLAAAAQTVWA